jgi:hypothetical protein
MYLSLAFLYVFIIWISVYCPSLRCQWKLRLLQSPIYFRIVLPGVSRRGGEMALVRVYPVPTPTETVVRVLSIASLSPTAFCAASSVSDT